MQHATNVFSVSRSFLKRIPLSKILHLFFRIPKTHSTSFLTLSTFPEK
ncbi:hypothetical protein ACHAWF_007428 [Thalassiosira exigua]